MEKCFDCKKEFQAGDCAYEITYGRIKESEMEELGLVFSSSPYKVYRCLKCYKDHPLADIRDLPKQKNGENK